MLKKLKIIIKDHWLIMALAVLIGFLVLMPTIKSIHNLGWANFKGVYPILVDDAEHYLSRTKEVQDDHPGLGNAYLAEHKNESYMAPPLAEWLLAKTAQFFHISIPPLFTVNNFVLPFIGVLLLYYLFFLIHANKISAACFSAFFYFLSLREMGRPIIVQLVFLYFFIGLIFVWKYYLAENQKKIYLFAALSGAMVGALVYISPYFWTALAVVSVLAIIGRLAREKKVLFFLKQLGIFFLTLFICALPYLFNLLAAVKSPFYAETTDRLGMVNTHWPACFFNVGFTILALVILFLVRKKISLVNFIFGLASAATAIIINWQNVITGKYLLFSTHYYLITMLLIFIILYIAGQPLLEKNNKFNKEDYVLLAAILFVILAIFIQHKDNALLALRVEADRKQMQTIQNLEPIFNWLNKETPKDSVLYFLNDSFYSGNALYPIYTDKNIYSGGCDGCFLISNDELIDRWIRYNIFNDNFNEDYLKTSGGPQYLQFVSIYQNQEVRNKIAGFFGLKFKSQPLIPFDFTDKIIKKYREVKKESPEKALKKYQIDYIVLDTTSGDYKSYEEKLKKLAFIKLIKRFDNILIYQVN